MDFFLVGDFLNLEEVFKKIEIDNSYPEYFVDNVNLYKDWII